MSLVDNTRTDEEIRDLADEQVDLRDAEYGNESTPAFSGDVNVGGAGWGDVDVGLTSRHLLLIRVYNNDGGAPRLVQLRTKGGPAPNNYWPEMNFATTTDPVEGMIMTDANGMLEGNSTTSNMTIAIYILSKQPL